VEENTFQIAGTTCGGNSAFKTPVSAPHFVDLILRVPAWELRGRNPRSRIGPFPEWGEGGRLLGGALLRRLIKEAFKERREERGKRGVPKVLG